MSFSSSWPTWEVSGPRMSWSRWAVRSLTLRYQELEQAKSVLAAQADQLQTVNDLGRELTKHTELKSLGDSVSRLLSERFQCTGQEFWLVRRPGEALQSVRQVGQLGPGEGRRFRARSAAPTGCSS